MSLKEYNPGKGTPLTDGMLKQHGYIWDKGRHCWYIPENVDSPVPDAEHIWLEYRHKHTSSGYGKEIYPGYYVYYGSTLLRSVCTLEQLQLIYQALEGLEIVTDG